MRGGTWSDPRFVAKTTTQHGQRVQRTVDLSRPRQSKADARAHIAELSMHGFSQLRRGDTYVVVNNRTLVTVDPGPMTIEEAERKADEMNTKVSNKMMDEANAGGFV